jgi:hypothetical protein
MNNNRNVDQYDLNGNFIQSFKSLHEAAAKTGVNISCICECCRNILKSTKGSIFKYNNTNVKLKIDPLDKLLFNDIIEEEDFYE